MGSPTNQLTIEYLAFSQLLVSDKIFILWDAIVAAESRSKGKVADY